MALLSKVGAMKRAENFPTSFWIILKVQTKTFLARRKQSELDEKMKRKTGSSL